MSEIVFSFYNYGNNYVDVISQDKMAAPHELLTESIR